MLLDLVIDIVMNIYQFLGFGTLERKIEQKMLKVRDKHEEFYNFYIKYDTIIESKPEIYQPILNMDVKKDNINDIYILVKEKVKQY